MSYLTLNDANSIIKAALESATGLGYSMAVAVVDLQTSLVASARMDGTNPFTPDVVVGKAMVTAVTKGTPSGIAADRFPSDLQRHVSNMYGGRLTWVQGAVPVFKGDVLVGAVAAGGGPPDQDELVAQAGADAIR